MLSYQVLSTPVGVVLVAGTGYAVTHIRHGENRVQLIADFLSEFPESCVMGNNGYLKEACEALTDYFAGNSTSVEIAMAPEGTDFQRRIWQELCAIPYGETITYSELAERAGDPDATRAAANACGANPIPFIIPCHRVVRKGGDLGGFALGVAVKEWLLKLEKERAEAAAVN